MPRFSPARFLAPLALIAAGVGVVVIVQSSRHDDAKPVHTAATTTQSRHGKSKRPRTYVVKQGDNLSAIADRTGVSLATIQRLNPNVDPQTLHAGQRLKLSR